MSFGKLHKDTFNMVLSFLPHKTIVTLNAVTTAVLLATQEWIEYNMAGDLIVHCHDEIVTPHLLIDMLHLWAAYVYGKATPNHRLCGSSAFGGVLSFHLVVDIKPKPVIFEARTTNPDVGLPFEIAIAPMGREFLQQLRDPCSLRRTHIGVQCCPCYHPQMRHGPPFWRCCSLFYFVSDQYVV